MVTGVTPCSLIDRVFFYTIRIEPKPLVSTQNVSLNFSSLAHLNDLYKKLNMVTNLLLL